MKNEPEIKTLTEIAKERNSRQLKNFLEKTIFYYWHTAYMWGRAPTEDPQFIQIKSLVYLILVNAK